ncbi:MAG: phosphoglycerate kinase, partial [Gaiellales bacterium]|nr:phosphoglycerate kinase [Gaiellales bacterium]
MRSVRDLDVAGKRVLVRADLNVPLDGGRVADDTRIRAAMPTVELLLERGARVILCSHLGRPRGEPKPELSLRPVADRVAELLDREVAFGDERGPLRMLENLRFDPREELNDPSLAAELASEADLYVNDAFGAAHRAHASTEGVAHLLPSAAGLLLEAELKAFASLLDRPQHPFVVVIGGVKVADKIGVIDRFTQLADSILIGGAMAFTFLAAAGISVGSSRQEDEQGRQTARQAVADAGLRGCELLLPVDVVVADRFAADASTRVVPVDKIPDGWMGLDIGPQTTELFAGRLASAQTVFWNGPMGVFELEPFAHGTLAVARAVAASGATSVVGGGDSVAAVNVAGVADQITHVSTG